MLSQQNTKENIWWKKKGKKLVKQERSDFGLYKSHQKYFFFKDVFVFIIYGESPECNLNIHFVFE